MLSDKALRFECCSNSLLCSSVEILKNTYLIDLDFDNILVLITVLNSPHAGSLNCIWSQQGRNVGPDVLSYPGLDYGANAFQGKEGSEWWIEILKEKSNKVLFGFLRTLFCEDVCQSALILKWSDSFLHDQVFKNWNVAYGKYSIHNLHPLFFFFCLHFILMFEFKGKTLIEMARDKVKGGTKKLWKSKIKTKNNNKQTIIWTQCRRD